MMKRVSVLALTAVMLVGLALPASASGSDGGGGGGKAEAVHICLQLRETRPQTNPGTGETTDLTAYWVPLEYNIDGEVFVEDLPIAGLAGCVTTVQRGGNQVPVPFTALSTLAINAQCRMLEQEMGITYPYNFYGNPDYLANNRADCIFFLRSFHLGTLPPGPGDGGE